MFREKNDQNIFVGSYVTKIWKSSKFAETRSNFAIIGDFEG